MNDSRRERLPLTFHSSFQPEACYLTALLQDAERVGEGTVEEISARTRIPTGKSTGKVEPLIKYAQGMGLINVKVLHGTRKRSLSLTSLGRVVLSNDPAVREENTQWALHLMLCRRGGGADAWYSVFVNAGNLLGRRFSMDKLQDFLLNRYGSSRDAIGPLLRSYKENSLFGRAPAIVQEGEDLLLRRVPTKLALYDTVGALLFMVWDAEMAGDAQIALTELEVKSGLISATGWSLEEQSQFLAALEGEGHLRVDRQTGAPILTRLATTEQILRVMYDRLV
ncbi:DUF4007 family protein [Ectothiorhodospira haloalkaliphila]|uniref:DUF4007 family protein n=1 Tax=Ectothiorhodospira haloalkaliphila TaxID=421628 RepID=UPI001EE796A2|nr:DUF4007 family protein [Ectothiorhodospira haloalkaliphila]MCG5523611.1 DUF4007 family protein [Ectothiorhodospira haloalkaliphila]